MSSKSNKKAGNSKKKKTPAVNESSASGNDVERLVSPSHLEVNKDIGFVFGKKSDKGKWYSVDIPLLKDKVVQSVTIGTNRELEFLTSPVIDGYSPGPQTPQPVTQKIDNITISDHEGDKSKSKKGKTGSKSTDKKKSKGEDISPSKNKVSENTSVTPNEYYNQQGMPNVNHMGMGGQMMPGLGVGNMMPGMGGGNMMYGMGAGNMMPGMGGGNMMNGMGGGNQMYGMGGGMGGGNQMYGMGGGNQMYGMGGGMMPGYGPGMGFMPNNMGKDMRGNVDTTPLPSPNSSPEEMMSAIIKPMSSNVKSLGGGLYRLEINIPPTADNTPTNLTINCNKPLSASTWAVPVNDIERQPISYLGKSEKQTDESFTDAPTSKIVKHKGKGKKGKKGDSHASSAAGGGTTEKSVKTDKTDKKSSSKGKKSSKKGKSEQSEQAEPSYTLYDNNKPEDVAMKRNADVVIRLNTNNVNQEGQSSFNNLYYYNSMDKLNCIGFHQNSPPHTAFEVPNTFNALSTKSNAKKPPIHTTKDEHHLTKAEKRNYSYGNLLIPIRNRGYSTSN